MNLYDVISAVSSTFLAPIYAVFAGALYLVSQLLDVLRNPVDSVVGVVAVFGVWLWDIIAGNGVGFPTVSNVSTNAIVNAAVPFLRFVDNFLPVTECVYAFVAVFFCAVTLGAIKLALVIYSLVPVIGRNT